MGKIQRKPTKLKIVTERKGGKKKWAKGHSSDSNPSTRIHREAAKNRFYHPTDIGKDLQMRDMKMLENMNLNFDDEGDDGSLISDADTVATRLSNITNCTNPTFDKVHRIWKSGSKLHSDVLTILASVTDAIKSKGGKENEVEYFAALLNPLIDPDYSNNLLAATCYLLNLVVRKVPTPILIQQFDRISEIIYGVVRKIDDSSPDDEIDSHQAAVLRYLLSSLGFLLEIRPKSLWSSPPHDLSMTKILETLLKFSLHEKPRVRKSAQKSIVQILIDGSTTPVPISKRCSEFCIQQMEQFDGRDGKKKTARIDSTLHVLNLLQHILHRFTSVDLKKTAETIFKLLTFGNNLTTTMATHCLYSMFRNRPTLENLSGDLNAKIILAIYDFQPSVKDAKTCADWIQLITEAHACLIERDSDLSTEYTIRLADAVALCLTNADNVDVINSAVNCLKKIYGEFVVDSKKSSRSIESSEKCLEILEKLLSPQYYAIWPHVLAFFAIFYESIGADRCSEIGNFKRSLKSIAELRESETFPCKLAAERAIAAAVRYAGVEIVLDAVPLGLNADSPSLLCALDFPRSWLLPILRSKICQAKLGYFSSYFLPLAIKIDQRVKELMANGVEHEKVEVKVLEAIECQIWELFPAFCNRPIDVRDAFPIIARALGAALAGRPKLRLSILSGLRKLSSTEKDVVARFGKNYLNILLQLYTNEKSETINDYDDDGVRLAILETIRSFLSIESIDSIAKYLEAVSEKLRIDGDDVDKKCRYMDILIVLAPHLNSDQRSIVYELVVEIMSSAEKRLQKKCWRLIEELCGGEPQAVDLFLEKNLSNLQNRLQSDSIDAAPATKACRLRCLLSILENLKDDNERNFDFVLAVVSNAVLCLNETSLKARKSAAKFIVKTVMLLANWKKDLNTALKIIFEKIMMSTEEEKERKGNEETIVGSLAAARLLCYEFRNDIAADILSSILAKVFFYLKNDDRPSVVQFGVEFLKTFVGCFSEITVGQFLDTIIESLLLERNDECRNYARRLIRKVVAKLVKRFSYVTVKKLVPENYEKQLNNIRKLVARSERKKKGTPSTISNFDDDKDETGTILTTFTNLSRPETIADLLKDTSDEDEDEEDEREKKFGKKRQRPSIWLKEGDEDEVIDLMDKKFLQQITATKPESKSDRDSKSKSTIKKNDRGFKTASDGRLVIAIEKGDDDEREEKGRNRKRKRTKSIESMDDDRSIDLEPKSKKEVKFEDEEEEKEEGTSNYVPGGKGIHRRLDEKKNGNKKTKGDKKSKNNVDPFAYVPMNKKALNKRKKVKMGGQLKNLVRGAKKGATKGSKGKKKKN